MASKRFGLSLIGLLALAATFYYWIRGEGEFTPEEVNSLLQLKDELVVQITKEELTGQRLQTPFLYGSLIPGWTYAGSTLVKSDEYIRLTSDNGHQAGSLWANQVVMAPLFEMELTFLITGQGLIGDGMAVWLLNAPSPIGDVFGARNYFDGLGVFIDTYRNGKKGKFPYVNVMVGNSQLKYDKATDGLDTRIAGCVAPAIVNPTLGKTKMRLVYLKNGYLSIDFNYHGNHEQWVNCVTIPDVDLPPTKYFGILAETGDLAETVDIYENRMFSLKTANGEDVLGVDQLEQLIADTPVVDAQKNQKRRKLAARMRMAEKRIKDKNRARRAKDYGDPDAIWIQRQWRKLITGVKYLVLAFFVGVLGWFGLNVYKGFSQNRRRKTTGLLD